MTASEGIALVSKIASMPDGGVYRAELRRLDTIVYSRLREALGVNAPQDIERRLTAFFGVYEQFHDYVQYGSLVGKSVAALGGASGSGKTSLVNALLGSDALPLSDGGAPMPPCYVVHGREETRSVINFFGAQVTLNPGDLYRVAQAFETPLTHLLRSACLVSPRLRYHSLTLLDLPGFTTLTASAQERKPEDILRQLNTADAVIWCIDAQREKLGEEELRRLMALHEEIPKVILLTKADLCPAEDLRALKESVRTALDLRAVRYEAVCTCSAREPKGYEMEELRTFLAQWNKGAHHDRFTDHFNALFEHCRSYYEETLADERRRLELLKALPPEPAYRAELSELERGLKRRVLTVTGARGQINTLRDNFFADYERISAATGLVRPAAEVVHHQAQEPMEWMQAYRKLEGIIADPGIVAAFRAIHMATAFNSTAGGALFRFRISDTLRRCCPKRDEERLTDGIRQGMVDTLRRMRLPLREEPVFLTQMAEPMAAEILGLDIAEAEEETGFRSFTEVAEIVRSAKISGVAMETGLSAPQPLALNGDGILRREKREEAE